MSHCPGCFRFTYGHGPVVPSDQCPGCMHEEQIAQLRADLAAVVEAAGNALDRLSMYDPNTSVIDELDRALSRPGVLALRR